MKTKVFLLLSAFFLLSSLALLAGLFVSRGIQAQSPEWDAFFQSLLLGNNLLGNNKNTGIPGHHVEYIEGAYYQEGGKIYTTTYYRLYNTSFNQEVVLGPCYVVERNGINGNYTVCDGLRGKTIPPLGSIGFPISATGVTPSSFSDGRGPLHTLFLWKGEEGALKIVGIESCYDPEGNRIGTRTVTPF